MSSHTTRGYEHPRLKITVLVNRLRYGGKVVSFTLCRPLPLMKDPGKCLKELHREFGYDLFFTYLLTYLLTYSVALIRKRTIPTKRPPLVCEVSANFC
jgi:hypothetical protein